MPRECEAVHADQSKEMRAVMQQIESQITDVPQPKGFRCHPVFRCPTYALPMHIKCHSFLRPSVLWQECSPSTRQIVCHAILSSLKTQQTLTYPPTATSWDAVRGGVALFCQGHVVNVGSMYHKRGVSFVLE